MNISTQIVKPKDLTNEDLEIIKSKIIPDEPNGSDARYASDRIFLS